MCPLPVRAFHPLRTDFPDGSSSCTCLYERSYNPQDASTPQVWALPVSIATTPGIDVFFLFLRVLRCFSSPRSLQLRWCQAFSLTGSPIRTPPDQFLFADPRGFSQLTASFIAFGSQGILRSLFFSFSYFVNQCFDCVEELPLCLFEIVVPSTKKLVSYRLFNFLLLYLVISLSIVNELSMSRVPLAAGALHRMAKDCKISTRKNLSFHTSASTASRYLAPKRRCSSHTFRYGYLVTT